VGLAALEALRRLPASWQALPLGTAIVNLVGCVAIGVVAGLVESRGALGPTARAFVMIGVLGGFTTFSSFALETSELLRDGRVALALSYALGAPVGGVLGVLLGGALARA
jgi:CrcB protein